MLFERPFFPTDETDPDFKRKLEASWYLLGVQLADQTYRLDKNFNPKLIDPYGTGTKAFWRGILETAGAIRLDAGGGGDRKYPYVGLKASHAFLTVFLAFLEEELGTRLPLAQGEVRSSFDFDGKLAWQAMGDFIWMKGTQARDVVRLLYLGETVGRDKPRRLADAIVTWEPAQRW